MPTVITAPSSFTNATKANVIAFVNAILGLLTAFDVAFTEAQKGAIIAVVNAFFALFVGTTYKNSPKRVPDPANPDPANPN